MKKRDVEKDRCFAMEEYTEFLREYFGKYRDITKIVFKVVGRIYRLIKGGASKEQVEAYIDILRKNKHK